MKDEIEVYAEPKPYITLTTTQGKPVKVYLSYIRGSGFYWFKKGRCTVIEGTDVEVRETPGQIQEMINGCISA